jgi:hypothetical protein
MEAIHDLSFRPNVEKRCQDCRDEMLQSDRFFKLFDCHELETAIPEYVFSGLGL